MASDGLILDISNEFLNNLKKADAAIEKIANVSDNSKQRIIQMFQDIDKHGISHVINKTNEMKRGLELLANAKIQVEGFETIQQDARNAIDEINRLTQSLRSTNMYLEEYRRNGEQTLRMYERMFDEIDRREQEYASKRELRNEQEKQNKLKQLSDEIKARQEYQDRVKRLEEERLAQQKQAETDFANYERQQFEESLSEYRRKKDDKAKVDKHYHDKYQRELEEMFRKEEQRLAQQSKNRADRYAYTQRYGDTSGQAIAAANRLYSQDGNRSLQQMQNTLSKLQQAQQKLNLNTEDGKKKYAELNTYINRVQNSIKLATGASNKFKQAQQGLSDVTKNLGRTLATVFSVQQVINYAQKVVDVRKEFELQHRSLQIIIQDVDEANKLWQQTVDLALESPFRVKELVKYTKQLAAYRIETEKLHDTTRMLADVSAGLGVDMQRLILAYGQVRAAEYLRGTELRQFTEAGVPMLDELARYFTEIEGKAVSTAEVFARISKRQVLFEDVEAVLQKMTGVTDGVEGVFYKMQERQAQTLHGMISNLHDSIDLMMNDIGQANDSMMKDLVSLAKTVVDNWRVLAVVIQQVGAVAVIIALRKSWASFLRLSPQVFAMSKGIASMSLTMNGLSMTTKRMIVAVRALTKAMLANPLFLGVTAVAGIVSIVHALYSFNQSIKATNEQYDEISRAAVRSMDKLRNFGKQVEDNNKIIDDATSSNEVLNKARGENANILSELQKLYPENFKNIQLNKNGTLKLTEAIKAQNEVLEQQILLNELSKRTFFHEDLKKNYSDAAEALGEVESAMISVKASMIDLKRELLLKKGEGKISESIYNELLDGIEKVQSAQTVEELQSAYGDFFTKITKYKNSNSISQSVFVDLTDVVRNSLSSLDKAIIHYDKDLESFGDNLDKHIDNVRVNVENLQDDAAKSKWIDDMLKHLGVADDRIRKWSGEYIAKKIGIEFIIVGDEKEKEYTTDDFIYEWQRIIWDAIEKIGEIDPVVQQRLSISIKDIVFAEQPEEIREKLKETLPNIFGKQKEILEWEGVTSQVVYDEKDIENAEKLKDATKALMDILALSANKKDTEDLYARRSKMIRDMAKAYEDLNDTFDDTTAKQNVIDSYNFAFKELFGSILDIEDIDITAPEGVISALDVLRQQVNLTAKQIRDIDKNISEVSLEIDVKNQEQNAERMIQFIEDMFGQYELSLELEELNIPKGFANQLFGLQSIDLSDINKQIQQEIDSGGWGEDEIKKLKEFQQKITEMELKEQQERLKKYLEYTREAIGERAKVKLEELHKLEEIEKTFVAKEGETPEEASERERAKQLAIQGVRREANEELQKLDWEALKSSDMFVDMFGDLENVSRQALDAMISQLETYKDQWTDLPVDQMKEIAKQLEKMRNASAEKGALESPFSYFKNNKRISQQEIQDAEETIISGQSEILGYDNQIAKLEIINNLISEKKDATDLINQYNAEYGTTLTADTKHLQEQKTILVDNKNTVQKTVDAQRDVLTEAQKQNKVLKAQSKYLGNDLKMAQDLYDAFKGLYEALGGDEDSPVAIFADMGMSMTETVIQTIQLQIQLDIARQSAVGLGVAMNSAMGVVGWIVMGVQLLTQAISAIVKVHDDKLQKQIELEQENVDELTKKYENLADSIDNAYNLSQLEQYAAESRKYTEDMIDSYEQMIALEEAKKRTDEDKINEYNDAILDAQEELADRQKELLSEVTDGILDSPKDAASEFLDAWMESLKEVGDGFQGLEEAANEMIANIIKKQIALSVVNPYLNDWQKKLKEYIDPEKGDLTLSIDEANDFADKVKHDLPYLSESLQNAFGSVSNLVDIFGDGGELAGLQKGIEGITEVQAEEITAYLNSLRFYVAQESEALINLANKVLSTDETVNPMLAQLRIIASQTTAINELLNSLTSGGHSMGGRGFRVFIS